MLSAVPQWWLIHCTVIMGFETVSKVDRLGKLTKLSVTK